jgi:glycosyltransferase involved in cell wall biosynthesis
VKVLVCVEDHFVQVGGDVYSRLVPPGFFQRYRAVWDDVVVLGRAAPVARPPAGSPRLDFTGVRLVGLPDYRGPSEYWRHRRTIRRIAQRALGEVDGIILRAPGMTSSVVWSLARRSGQAFGVEVVGDPWDALAPGAARHPLRRIFRWLFRDHLRRQCREASATAYNTETGLRRRYPPSPGRFTTSYSCIELARDHVRSAARQDFPARGPYRVITVASFASLYKAHDVVLKALAEAVTAGSDVHGVFVGDGTHRPAMERLSGALGLTHRVRFLGELPAGDAVRAELDRAHLFVLPSRADTLPRAMIEAMARGLPCIGSTVGGMPDLLAVDERVAPNEPSALARAITELLRDPARMARLSHRNLAVAARYTTEVLQARRSAFYAHLRGIAETSSNRP